MADKFEKNSPNLFDARQTGVVASQPMGCRRAPAPFPADAPLYSLDLPVIFDMLPQPYTLIQAMSKPNPSTSRGSADYAGLLPVSNSRRWMVIGLLFIASFINYLDRATISVALPFISLDLHLGPETKGLLLSSFFWSYALMQVPIGWCVDRTNLRWLYAGLFAIWSLACGFTGLAGSLAVLILARIVLGIGESIYLPGGTKIAGMLFSPEERAFPSGLFDSGTRLGLAVGAPLVAMLILHFGWRKMFMLVGFTAVLWIVPWILGAPRKLQVAPSVSAPAPQTIRPHSFARVGAIGLAMGAVLLSHAKSFAYRGVLGATAGVVGYFVTYAVVWPVRRTHFSRNLLGICLGFFCFDYYWYLLVTWLPDYLVTVRHLTLMRAGFYAALPYLVYGACQPMGGWISDWFIRWGYDATRTRKTVITIAFLTGLFIIPAARVASPVAALALLACGSVVGLSAGNLFAIIQCCAPPEELGVWTGMENFAGNIAGVLAPIVTGFLIARTGTYLPGFAVAAIVLAAGILAYWFIVGELKPAA
jgi:MFS transporter, ACS family, D-galactonate transporter